jgi:hypothetical protein
LTTEDTGDTEGDVDKELEGGKVRVKGVKGKRAIDAEGASGAAAPFEMNG